VPSHLDDFNNFFHETNSADISFGDLNVSYPVEISGRTIVSHRTVDEEDILLHNIQLSGSATLPPNDTIPPTVSIVSPTVNGRLLTNLITGKAGDNRGVAEVFYRIGSDDFVRATGTDNWSAEVSLQPGTNVVEVKSIDFAGNESVVLTRSFFYVVTSPLAVEINNSAWGSTTLTNGQLLELARNYSITAKPAPGYLFQDWTGNVNSQSATISFLMEPDFLLQPNFVPNPFISMEGIYNGLFSDTNGVTPPSAGFFTAAIKESGAFTGKILLEGARHSFSGKFAVDGQADKTILRRKKSPLNLHLQLGFDGTLSGTVSQAGASSDLFAELALTNSAKAKYTLLIPPAADPATAPGGYGFGSASVNSKGKLRFHGFLGNTTRVSQGAAISQNGRWPLFVSHGSGKGVLLGWLWLTNEIDNDLRSENVTWARLPRSTDRFYPNGFTNSGTVIGSLYSPPSRGIPVLNATSGLLEFNDGNLASPLTNTFVLHTNNKFMVASTNRTTLQMNTSNGLLRGRFVHPDTRKMTFLRGAILQKPMFGAGFFRGTNQIGAWVLQANPDP
jgi:hypothetical protein